MRLFQILNNIDCSIIRGGDVDIDIGWITIDSRKVVPGTLFVCIKGLHTDGHKYIESALENGALAVIVEDVPQSLPAVPVIKVADSRLALSYAAASFYGNPADKLNLIGITGTNGKTSSTYFMEAILKEIGHKPGLIGTMDTRIDGIKIEDLDYNTGTTPDPMELQQILARMVDEDVDDVVMEVSSHALEFHKVEGITFDVGIFTNLTQDHLDLHKNMENYRKAKAKLFKQCRRGVVNLDDDASAYMMMDTECKFTTYSIDRKSELQAFDLDASSEGVGFSLMIDGREERFNINIPGQFTIYNALGVIGASLAMGIPTRSIRRALNSLEPIRGRIQSIPNDRGINIIVDYSHTPDSLENIIRAVRGFTEKRIITVFGCGGDRDRTKRPIMGEIAGAISDYCIITSDNPRSEEPEQILRDIEPGVKNSRCSYEKVVDRRTAIFRAIEMAGQGDSVIIAGKGHETYQIFADRTIHFDDCEVAEEALKKL